MRNSPCAGRTGRVRGHVAAKVYRDLATRRTGVEREILLELAEAEERHAAHWARLLGDEVGRTRRGAVRMR
ncbi:MAG: rubrerythrin family protein, partial [Actinobacteria bacterium]|nr:rubrerythrin family protein [Actinomycetota bacterium]